MYFWNTRQLALDLRDGKVTERQQMWYFFVFAISTSVYLCLLHWIPSEYTSSSKSAGVAELAINVVGFLVCYQANSRGDAKEFVVRFICMSWPVMWRILADQDFEFRTRVPT